tara:strand:+ start:478 stop:681 length:204 start_codon:yes stop_codon:yes gene_type:complete
MSTSVQKRYKEAMRKFFIENDQMPPVSVLAEIMERNPTAAAQAQSRLEAQGIIERNSVGKYKRGRNW